MDLIIHAPGVLVAEGFVDALLLGCVGIEEQLAAPLVRLAHHDDPQGGLRRRGNACPATEGQSAIIRDSSNPRLRLTTHFSSCATREEAVLLLFLVLAMILWKSAMPGAAAASGARDHDAEGVALRSAAALAKKCVIAPAADANRAAHKKRGLFLHLWSAMLACIN